MSEPVAWMDKESNITMIGGIYPKKLKQYLNGLEARIFALETNPVKDLEDIDINITWNENSMRDFGKDELNFAKAILRKAQE